MYLPISKDFFASLEHSTRKQVIWASAIMIGVILIFGLVKAIKISNAIAQSQAFGPPPDAVPTIVAKEEIWARSLAAIGSVVAVQGVTLSAEEPGKVTKINFDSGAFVKQGDVLVELDIAVEQALLDAAQAKSDRSKRMFERGEKLRTTNAMSQDLLEDADSQARQAQAQVESIRAAIARKKIVAPFDGRTGIRLVNIGQYLAAGTAVVPLHSLDPVYVNFSLPQQVIAQVAVGQTITLTVDSFVGEIFGGKISSINPQIDAVTRNGGVQATIANPKEQLRPGMFGNVSVLLSSEDKVIALPATSISYAPYGDTVYVVESMKDHKGKDYLGVRQQVVKLGRKRGEQVAVLEGLKPGEQVVTAGAFKLRPGSAVVVNNSIVPGNNPEPKPADS